MKQGREDFDVVKENNDAKENYIFKKDSITKIGFYIITIVLLILIIATIYYGLQTID